MILTVSINGMIIHAHHGLFPQERIVGNDFEVSASLDVLTDEESVLVDSMEGTVNYAEIASIIRTVMHEPCELLETVAARIRRAIIGAYPVVFGGTIVVKKLTPPIPSTRMESASVTLKWP